MNENSKHFNAHNRRLIKLSNKYILTIKMDTPRKHERQNYASPIRLLKTPSRPNNAYEEEFYKIKSQRLET